MAFGRRIRATIAMYQNEGQLTFAMGQALLQAVTDDVEEISEAVKKAIAQTVDGITIELVTEGKPMDWLMGNTKTFPIKARVVIDDKKPIPPQPKEHK